MFKTAIRLKTNGQENKCLCSASAYVQLDHARAQNEIQLQQLENSSITHHVFKI